MELDPHFSAVLPRSWTPACNILKVPIVWVQNWWFCCHRCPSRMCTGTVVARVNCEPSSDYAVINLKKSRRSHLGALQASLS